MMREVRVPQEQSVYRCRIESTTTAIRKQPRWRYVIERTWSQIPEDMLREEHWKVRTRGPKVTTHEAAVEGGRRWMDEAQARNADDDEYI